MLKAAKTSNYALRTFPEFKEAAAALSALKLLGLYERSLGPDGKERYWATDLSSINAAFNSLIAKGLPAMLALVDKELSRRQAALEIMQDIMRFLLDHPAARRAYAANFPSDSPAQRVLAACDAGLREAEENEGSVDEAARGLTDPEAMLFEVLDEPEDGIGRATAATQMGRWQDDVVALTEAKGALQRALATQGEAGSRAP
jgi:hypothetical protein